MPGKLFFADLTTEIDHVMVTAGRQRYGPLLELGTAQARKAISDHAVPYLEVAQRRKQDAAARNRSDGACVDSS